MARLSRADPAAKNQKSAAPTRSATNWPVPMLPFDQPARSASSSGTANNSVKYDVDAAPYAGTVGSRTRAVAKAVSSAAPPGRRTGPRRAGLHVRTRPTLTTASRATAETHRRGHQSRAPGRLHRAPDEGERQPGGDRDQHGPHEHQGPAQPQHRPQAAPPQQTRHQRGADGHRPGERRDQPGGGRGADTEGAGHVRQDQHRRVGPGGEGRGEQRRPDDGDILARVLPAAGMAGPLGGPDGSVGSRGRGGRGRRGGRQGRGGRRRRGGRGHADYPRWLRRRRDGI